METRIVWLEDPAKYEWLRETVDLSWRSKGRPKMGERKLIGYAEIERGDGNQLEGWVRRAWYLSDWDHGMPNVHEAYADLKGCPCEAVVPASIKLNEKSEKFWVPGMNHIGHRGDQFLTREKALSRN